MRREQVPGPDGDGEERSSSPSPFSGKGRNRGPRNRAPGSAGPGRIPIADRGAAAGPGKAPGPDRVTGGPAGEAVSNDAAASSGQPAEAAHPAQPGQSAGPVRPEAVAGFAEGGAADVLAPGVELAGLLCAVTRPGGSGLGVLADRELLGVLGAAHKMAAWAAWLELVTLAEFTRRRPALAAGVSGARAAAEEAAWVSAESWSRMLDQAVFAQTAAARLPQTLAAVGEGTVSAYKLTIVAGQTADLTDEDVAKADVMLAAAAMLRNPAALRDFARRQVARLDPQAMTRRKERALRRASVRVWQEDSGNMALSAREMPTGDGQIAWQNIERRALDLHAGGMAGTTGQLQVQAMLDYLLGRAVPDPDDSARKDARADEGAWDSVLADEGARENAHAADAEDGEQYARLDAHGSVGSDAHTDDAECAWENAHPDAYQSAWPDAFADALPDAHDGDEDEDEDQARDDEDEDGQKTRAWLDARANARKTSRGGGRGGWAVNPVLIVPWDPSLGGPSGPAELPGYGLVAPDDTTELLDAAGLHPASRWCLTATGADGTAVAHACLPGQRTLDAIAQAGKAVGGTWTAADLAAALGVTLEPIAKGACDHAHAEPGYRPSRKLRHLIAARNARCTAYGCGRPASACDYDHTQPWDDGGITCECNLGPLCRLHHRIKQAQGWKLEQPEPGVLVWTTPAGLTRTTIPTDYR
jgi:hypothetical protein